MATFLYFQMENLLEKPNFEINKTQKRKFLNEKTKKRKTILFYDIFLPPKKPFLFI